MTTDDLGVIRIDALDRRGGLQLRLGSDDSATRALLNERLPQLRDELRDSGMNLGSLDVGGRGADTGARSQAAPDSVGSARHRTGRADGTSHDGEVPAIDGHARPNSNPGRVDLRL
jgi:flagellar hook-length control protein FliK